MSESARANSGTVATSVSTAIDQPQVFLLFANVVRARELFRRQKSCPGVSVFKWGNGGGMCCPSVLFFEFL